MKKKKYNAVQEVRKIREKLSVKYWNNPELFTQDLKAASKRFNEHFKPVDAQS